MFKCIVDARGSRERFTLLKSKRIDTNKYEAKATGINPDIAEDDKLMDDIIERCHEFKEIISVERDVDQINQGKDRRAAEDIRLQAMETYNVSRKRNELDLDSSRVSDSTDTIPTRSKKSRISAGTETMQLLKEASEKKEEGYCEEQAYKASMLSFQMEKEKRLKEELDLKREQLALDAETKRNQNNFNVQLLRNVQEDRVQQQQQNQQLMGMMLSMMQNFTQKK